MTTFLKLQAFSKPFDVNDYREKSKNLTNGIKTKSISMNDREEIRKRLAMECSDEPNPRSILRKSKLIDKLQNGTNLQICFMNESPTENEKEYEYICESDMEKLSMEDNRSQTELEINVFNNNPNTSLTSHSLTEESVEKSKRPTTLFTKYKNENKDLFNKQLSCVPKPLEKDEFQSYHSRLHDEARLALSQAKSMAKMQIEVERKSRKHVLSDFLDVPYRFDQLSLSHLQLLVNDLLSQIESLNEELVKLLIQRDEESLQQDAILVDVEDLTMFLYSKE